MPVTPSRFSQTLSGETAFAVLALAKKLQGQGRDIVELEIGDSPFESPAIAKETAIAALRDNQTRYCPSPGLPEFRAAAAAFVNREFGLSVQAAHVVVTPGAKPAEQFFCEAFLEPNDGALVFSPHFSTYPANIARRGGRMVTAPLRHDRQFRPDPADVAQFLEKDPAPKAIFLNSPHNPTGGVAQRDDLQAIAELVRGRDIAVFSDEPYCHMVWQGRHHSLLAEPGMLEQTVAAYTFSKSYSMSGWRLGFAVCAPEVAERIGVMINTSLSCIPPFVQLAGQATLESADQERDETMRRFQTKVERLVAGLRAIEGFEPLPPISTFYVFPRVTEVCRRWGITSHGLALYLLEGADDRFGVACLGGECFGEAGQGFLRFSCAEPDERIDAAAAFIKEAVERGDRIARYLEAHPQYRLAGNSP